PVSGLATLHLVVKMAEDLIGTVRLLVTDPPAATSPVDSRPRLPAAAVDGSVLRIVRANPRTTWRVVKDRTGLTDANAKRALTAARKRLRATEQDAHDLEAVDPRPAHTNGKRD